MSASQLSSTKQSGDTADETAESDASSGYDDFEPHLPSSRFLPPSSSSHTFDDDEAEHSGKGYLAPQTMSMQTEVGQENIGYGLLRKMGWAGAGTGLGREGEGALLVRRPSSLAQLELVCWPCAGFRRPSVSLSGETDDRCHTLRLARPRCASSFRLPSFVGLSPAGRTTPIAIPEPTPGLGIGKLGQETRNLDEVTSKGRRELASERWAGMSEEERGREVVRPC